ncbi:zinc finger protein VAR3, chloroplastic-like [Wolffia australiana]
MAELAVSLLLPSAPFSSLKPCSSRLTRIVHGKFSPFLRSGFSLTTRFRPFLKSLDEDRAFRVSAGDPSSESVEKWPEWEKMIEYLAALGYMNRHTSQEEEDIFSMAEEIPGEFVVQARACLMFARERPDLLRSLPRKDIQVIVESLSPVLFKNAEKSAKRMKAFIENNGNNALGAEQAYTVDLMKYLLTCAFDFHHRAAVRGQTAVAESSFRCLFHELTKAESAKGARPKRQLSGREWECPQCEFFNNGRNSSCLRCDYPRPPNEILKADASLAKTKEPEKMTESEISRRLDKILGRIASPAAETPAGEVNSTSSSNENSDGFPDLMPMRKGENRFVVSKKKDRSLTSPQYKRRIALDQAGSSDFVPFVPFPPDYFARKEDQKKVDDDGRDDNSNGKGGDDDDDDDDDDGDGNGVEQRRELEAGSLEGTGVKGFDPSDMSEEAKAQRWFRRVAQITDIEELSKIPDEDFPEIMPMRKGVNRFVVSKRKTPLERRLSSQQRVDLPQKGSNPGDTFSDEGQENFW